MKQVLGLLFLLSLLSCGGRRTTVSTGEGDTVTFRYATQLTVVRYNGYTVATLKNPWKEGMVLHQYVLVPKDEPLPPHLPKGTVVRTPLERSVIFSTVHCAMLMAFDKQSAIAGVADLKYIKIPWIQEQVREGRMMDVGDGMNPVIEKIIDRHPDALFLSPFENSGGYGKLEEIDIPIVECAEYMETSPLARAEWIRFYGMLFGCERRADSLFQVTDSSYHALKALAQKASGQKRVLVDKVTGSVWYVPGGKSTLGQMLTDANGSYPWVGDTHSGSVALPFESVLEKAGDADTWLFRYSSDHPITYGELKAEHHGYDQFKAYREQEVYGCNVEQSLFYEESPFRPDWLLNDIIRILHPEIEGLAPLRYYQKLSAN